MSEDGDHVAGYAEGMDRDPLRVKLRGKLRVVERVHNRLDDQDNAVVVVGYTQWNERADTDPKWLGCEAGLSEGMEKL